MNDYKFGNFIYTLRTEKELTQADIAQMLGVTSAAVSKWENGSSKPKYETLSKLAEILGVKVEELVAGEHITAQEEITETEVLEPSKNKTLLPVAIASLTLCVAIIFACLILAIPPQSHQKSGLNSNNQRYSMVVEHGGWLYYCNPFSRTPYFYKMHPDKSEKECLVKDTVMAICVTDDWVYYSDQTTKNRYAGIYRMKHGDSQSELLASGIFWYVCATDEWIYYADGNPTSGGKLYRMKPDGTRTEQLTREFCKSFSISGESIYYLSAYNGHVYRLDPDTKAATELESENYLRKAVVEDGVLYTYDDQILKIQKLGSAKYKEYPQKDIKHFLVCNGYIYIAKETSKKTIFYKVDTNLRKHTEIYKMDSFFSDIYMCVIDDWLYFSNTDKSDEMYRVKTDGSGEIELVN